MRLVISLKSGVSSPLRFRAPGEGAGRACAAACVTVPLDHHDACSTSCGWFGLSAPEPRRVTGAAIRPRPVSHILLNNLSPRPSLARLLVPARRCICFRRKPLNKETFPHDVIHPVPLSVKQFIVHKFGVFIFIDLLQDRGNKSSLMMTLSSPPTDGTSSPPFPLNLHPT